MVGLTLVMAAIEAASSGRWACRRDSRLDEGRLDLGRAFIVDAALADNRLGFGGVFAVVLCAEAELWWARLPRRRKSKGNGNRGNESDLTEPHRSEDLTHT